MRADLSSFPRVALGNWPTPLERCERLDAPGEVWLKREDCSGLGFGGNKVRKLEFLLGRALADGAQRVLTFGAVQSNHVRQTAAACAKLGLPFDAVLIRVVPKDDEAYNRSGNVLLDRTFGATMHVVDLHEFGPRLEELRAQEGLFEIPAGGSDAIGTLGYVDASYELADQCAEREVGFDRIVVATSTGGTAAGLILGAHLAGIDAIVDVVSVYAEADAATAEVRALMDGTAGLLGVDVPGDDHWTLTDSELGDGYGIASPACLAAIDRLAKREGVLLDPVYSAKAFAFLLRDPRYHGTRSLFIHTGGAPSLFAYGSELVQ